MSDPTAEPVTVEFLGESFRVADRIGALPLMRFAKAARSGVDSMSLDGLAAMYDLLRQCIADDEWQRFEEHADRTHADGDDLMTVVTDVVEAASGRPTRRPSGSPGGSSTENTSSPAGSSSPAAVIAELEGRGRPDLALIVSQAQRSTVSA